MSQQVPNPLVAQLHLAQTKQNAKPSRRPARVPAHPRLGVIDQIVNLIHERHKIVRRRPVRVQSTQFSIILTVRNVLSKHRLHAVRLPGRRHRARERGPDRSPVIIHVARHHPLPSSLAASTTDARTNGRFMHSPIFRRRAADRWMTMDD